METMTLKSIFSRNCEPSPQLMAALEEAVTLRSVHKGEELVKQGEVCDSFILNKSGFFRIGLTTGEVEDTLMFGTDGDVFTSAASYVNGRPSEFSLMALEEGEVWVFPFAKYRELSREYPELVQWLCELAMEQIAAMEDKYARFSDRSAEARFRRFLDNPAFHVRHYAFKQIAKVVPLKYIAQYLKVTPATLSRLRRQVFKK